MTDRHGDGLAAAALHRLVTAGIRPGATRHRWDRPVKNGRWYALGPGVVAKVGWGDLTLGNLRDSGPALGAGWAFVVLPANPPGGVHLHPSLPSAVRGD